MDASSETAWLLLAAVGVAAGYVNVVAGGGSLIAVPALIFLGMPETAANGTSRIAILVQNVFATATYDRAGKLDRKLLLRLSLPSILGAAIGAVWAAHMPDASFRNVFGWVMLACAALVALPGGVLTRNADARAPRLSLAWVWPVMLVIGFYGGLIQAGIGYLILALLTFGLRLSLLDANVMKVAVVLVYTPVALAAFLLEGKVVLVPGIALSVGQALGGFLGARAAIERGEPFIRLVLLVVVVASAAKLLFW